jgi:hypothetical protein
MNLIFQYLFPSNSQAKRQMGLISILIQILLSIFLLLFISLSTSAFIFFGIAILPTIIFMFLDSGKSYKFEFATVSAFNLLGILPYLITMIANWSSLETYAVVFLLEPRTWLIIYGSSLIGKLVYVLLPKVISEYHVRRFHEQKMKLIFEKNALRKLWGIGASDLSAKETLQKNDK